MAVSSPTAATHPARGAFVVLGLVTLFALVPPGTVAALTAGGDAAAAGALPDSALQVRLEDALSGAALPGERIDAYQRRADGTLAWRAQAQTDGDGEALFDLAHRRMEPGLALVLRARPFGSNAYSDPITGAGRVRFAAGKLGVTLIGGATGAPMPGTAVVFKRLAANGTMEGVGRTLTDAHGVARFDPPGLGEGARFVALARSTVSGRWKASEPMAEAGGYRFRVGNAPASVIVVDALAHTPLAGIRVDAVALPASGEKRWLARADTDAGGAAHFDIDGLGSPDGPVVEFRARVFGATATSASVSAPGTTRFPVGTLTLALVSGTTGDVLPGEEVRLREVLAHGESRWAARAVSDADGVVRLTPAGLGAGRRYRARARSPVTGQWKDGDVHERPGRYPFRVGNAALTVTLVDGVSGAPLPEQRIDALELPGDGSKPIWRARAVTDGNGVAPFDLDGLGGGRVYALRTRAYDAGTAQTPPIDATGRFLFRIGTAPVTLIDGDTDAALPGRTLVAYRVAPDGSRHWHRSGVTDDSGTVRFDLDGVGNGATYRIKAVDPFGDQQQYWNGPIDREGPVRFVVLADADRIPPAIAIVEPGESAQVAPAGFVVRGTASDDESLAGVSLRVGDAQVAVERDDAAGTWSATVAGDLLATARVTLSAVARDAAGNEATATRSVEVASDTTAPRLAITSHADGASVPATGFVLFGTASDDFAVAGVTVSVTDPLLGATAIAAPASFEAGSGNWSLRILSGQISAGETIAVTVRARDAADNLSIATRSLAVVPLVADVRHLVNRTTFGPTTALLERVNTIGPAAYLAEQLDPDGVDDSALEAMLAGLAPIESTTDLQAYLLLHAVHGKRQLREIMTVFWDNHFNTAVNASNSGQDNSVAHELAENRAFRANALGRFRDLLAISAKSPAMLIYLDSISNVAGAPNENYPRELLELHTMGVDGGYTQGDVEEVARAFTGWRIQGGSFHFDPSLHDTGEKSVLGRVIAPGGGVSDGEAVLDVLAAHGATARFVCAKLAVALVSDAPPQSLVDGCAATFQATADAGDQIAQVLAAVLTSPEFHDPAIVGAKVKTPLELTAGIARGLEATGTLRDLPDFTRAQGMRLFENPVPTGFADTADAWLSPGQLLERYKTADRIVFNAPGGNRTSVRPLDLAQRNGAVTAAGVVAFLLDLTVGPDVTDLERQVALDVLTDAGATPYDPSDPVEADARLRAVLGTVMSFPAYQFQ